MRRKRTQNGLSLRAIAGSHVVLLGINMKEADCKGLMGFAIHRTDHVEEEAYWLRGIKTFKETDPGFPPGAMYSTRHHPIQGFSWCDFSAKPGYVYTYRVVALFGSPSEFVPKAEVRVRVKTEDPKDGFHDIFYNRGAAASEEYTRRFGYKQPGEIGKAAFNWLSRGLLEAILEFIQRGHNNQFEFRVCAYEFRYPPILEALRDAKRAGATINIIYDARKEFPRDENEQAARDARIKSDCIKRDTNKSYISHNKFIVLRKNGIPVAVLTGSTSFSEGGIFGQSNLVHIVEEPAVAAQYDTYWEILADDPEARDLRPQINSAWPVPQRLSKGEKVLFSPRKGLEALQWYADLAKNAKDALFATFAFGMHPLFQEAYKNGQAKLRYALMDKATRPLRGDARIAEAMAIKRLRYMEENRFAIGTYFRRNTFDRWLGGVLTGLNHHVRYIHTKYMLIDPLGRNPIIISGSANFSEASTTKNDENMLVIKGNKRAADVYLGEFMRLYNHYAFREWALKHPHDRNATPKHLRVDDWWKDYFGTTSRSRQREYFAGI